VKIGIFSISWGRLHFATIHWIPAFAGMTGIYIQNVIPAKAGIQTSYPELLRNYEKSLR